MLITLLECAGMILRCKAPELLGIVETDKAGIITEELGIYRVLVIIISVLYVPVLVGRVYDIVVAVIVRKMTLSARCRLHHAPYAHVRTGLQP